MSGLKREKEESPSFTADFQQLNHVVEEGSSTSAMSLSLLKRSPTGLWSQLSLQRAQDYYYISCRRDGRLSLSVKIPTRKWSSCQSKTIHTTLCRPIDPGTDHVPTLGTERFACAMSVEEGNNPDQSVSNSSGRGTSSPWVFHPHYKTAYLINELNADRCTLL